MLPSPAVSRYQRKIRFNPTTSPRKQLFETFTRRSRITNLGVFILIGVCAISILFNLRYWVSAPYFPHLIEHNTLQLASVERPLERKDLTHLIIVPCHSIWKGKNSWLDEKDWMLESYQKGPGRVRAFYEHIARSAQLAKDDPHSLLIFSGGQTKLASSTTEAESYLRLAQTAGVLPDQSPSSQPFGRATTENYAMDSYQNLLFSIARFHEYTGHFPTSITVVGYEFKQPRFEELHRVALRWPKRKFDYIGVDPDHGEANSAAVEGELYNGYKPYSEDTYGCHSVLIKKRRQRNPHARFHPYDSSVPELTPLLDWCPRPGQGLFGGDLPWDHATLRRES